MTETANSDFQCVWDWPIHNSVHLFSCFLLASCSKVSDEMLAMIRVCPLFGIFLKKILKNWKKFYKPV